MSKISGLSIAQIERFHLDNLYIPTRVIYFAGTEKFTEQSDEVSVVSVAQLIKNIHILDSINSDPITLLLNTCGGEWESGIAVYDLIKKTKSKVYIIGLGKLYSMGSVIFQAGYKRYIYPNTLMLIHNGSEGYYGDPKSFENHAKISKSTREIMYKIYYDKMIKKNKNITLKEIEELCSHDSIFNSEEIVNLGLADKII